MAEPFAVGERVTWLHVPRGGYGYAWPVDATILSVGPRRVRIEVQRHDGQLVTRYVDPANLRRKEAKA